MKFIYHHYNLKGMKVVVHNVRGMVALYGEV